MQSIKTRVLAVPAMVLAVTAPAMAALPAGVSDAIDTYKNDAMQALGMILAAGVAIWGMRKLGSKLGWL